MIEILKSFVCKAAYNALRCNLKQDFMRLLLGMLNAETSEEEYDKLVGALGSSPYHVEFLLLNAERS